MAKRKRSEQFYQNRENRNPKNDRSSSSNLRKNNKKRKVRKRKRGLALPLFRIIFLVFLLLGLVLVIYQIYVSNPNVTIKKSLNSITDLNYSKQSKYYDRVDEINKVLRDSYSKDEEEAEEFLKANYSNLDIQVKQKNKTQRGLELSLEVTNVNYIDVFDKVVASKSENLHRDYINALQNEGQDKSSSTVKVLMVRKFDGYKIFESRDFINAILGGALDYADEIEDDLN